jgi:hypothetical protein
VDVVVIDMGAAAAAADADAAAPRSEEEGMTPAGVLPAVCIPNVPGWWCGSSALLLLGLSVCGGGAD